MADKYDGIESSFDKCTGITLVELVSGGCPGNLINLVCGLRSQPDTPIPSPLGSINSVLLSFQFPDKILVDIIDDFDEMDNWKEGVPSAKHKFSGSDMLYLYFCKEDVEGALAITRARAVAGIDGWKHHHFADEYEDEVEV